MTGIRTRRGVLVALGMAVGIALLSGCTTTGDGAPDASTSPTVTPPEHGTFPMIPTGTGVIRSTVMTGCTTEDGLVTAVGRITLPEGATAAPVVSVSWADITTSAVHARGLATIEDAEPGATVSWEVSAELSTPDDVEVRCVLGAVIPD